MHYFISFIVLLALTGRSDSKENPSSEPTHSGDLVELLDTLYAPSVNARLDKYCDIQLKDEKYQIAKDLEKYKDLIQDYNNTSLSSQSNVPLLQMGPYTFINKLNELNEPSEKDGKDEWVTKRQSSWYELVEFYRAIKNSVNAKDWSWLNRKVHFISTNDYWRIVKNRSYALTLQDKIPLVDLTQKLESCLKDPACTQPTFTSPELKWISSKAFYKPFLNRLQQAKQPEKIKIALSRFYNRLKLEFKNYFEFTRYKHQVDRATQTLTIRMDLSSLGEGAKSFIDLIEKAWSQFGFTLKIRDTKHAAFDFIKLQVHSSFIRSQVRDNVMHISNHEDVLTLIHEMGHVIGLRDRYYEVWDNYECVYTQLRNYADLMSIQDTGKILESHIQEIKDIYFK